MEYIPAPNYLKKDSLTEQLELLDLHLVTFGFWEQQEHACLKNNILSNYKLVCIVKGTCTVSFHKQDYFLKEGDSIIIAPFVLYHATCTSQEPVSFFFFHFDVKHSTNLLLFNELFHCHQASVFTDSIPVSAVSAVRTSYDLIMNHRPGAYFSAKLILQRLLLNIQQNTYTCHGQISKPHHSTSEERVVTDAIQYLTQHLSEKISVDDLCSAIHVSQSYLYQSFLSITGISTKEFMITYKLKRLEVDLTQSGSSMKEIAERYGFSSVYAFSNQFKKYYGISPLQYRKQAHH